MTGIGTGQPMRVDSGLFTVQVDPPGTQQYHVHGSRVYPPAGPVGEGAGDGVGTVVEPGKVPFFRFSARSSTACFSNVPQAVLIRILTRDGRCRAA